MITIQPLFINKAKEGRIGLSYLKSSLIIILFIIICSWVSSFALAQFQLSMVDSYLGLLIMFFPFFGILLGVYYATTSIHNRNPLGIFTGSNTFRFQLFFKSLFIFLCINILLEIAYAKCLGGEYQFQFSLQDFIPVILLSLFVIPIQTTAEEVLFRSYILQGISLLSKYKWIPVIISSLLFALMHISNPENAAFGYGLMFSYYFISAIILASLTVMSNGLEIAMGIHAATNMYGMSLVTFESSAIPTKALFVLTNPSGIIMFCLSIVALSSITFIFRKELHWKETLFTKHL